MHATPITSKKRDYPFFCPKVAGCTDCTRAASFFAEAKGGLYDTSPNPEAESKACRFHGNRSKKILNAVRFTGETRYYLELANGESYYSDSPTKLVNAVPYRIPGL